MSIQSFLPLLSIVLTVCLGFGGLLAWRKGYSQESAAIQDRVITALKEEVSTLHNKVDELVQERSTQDRVIATIRYVLKQYNLRVTISGDVVTINDNTGMSKSLQIRDRASVKPIARDENDDS